MTTYEKKIDELRDLIIDLGLSVEKLVRIVKHLSDENAALEDRIRRLEARKK